MKVLYRFKHKVNHAISYNESLLCIGFQLPDFSLSGLSISKEFTKPVYFFDSQFLGYADFFGANFKGEANFRKTTFCNEVNFTSVKFSQARFHSARFLE